ncbi:MAG: 1-deoxy-D-xylulose-5-phosphate synthase, partial [Spirochaetota bacterium]|nr:1-deoxy-D-xylulose-5-phosphate synthase [Spirochaetota bacterium]
LILMGYGVMANSCLEAAKILEREGISATVVDPRFVKPLDQDLLGKLFDQNVPIITLEDHSVMGGFGSAVLELASQLGKNPQIHMLGIPDRFIEHGNRQQILKNLWLDAEGVVSYIKMHVMDKVKVTLSAR